jgi:uncharacterized protein DUF6438
MRSFVRSFASAFAFCALASTSLAAQPSETSKPMTYKIQDVEMTLKRTSCYGTCPVYSISVSGEGKGSYYGSQYVKVGGQHEFQLTPRAALDLYNEFVGIDFASMHDSYRERPCVFVAPDGTVQLGATGIVDAPGFEITLRIGSYVKTISVNGSLGPQDLMALADKIDAATNSKRWIRGE